MEMEMEGETKRELTYGNEEEAQAEVDIWKCVFGFTELFVVKCAIELGVSDILEKNHQEPMTLSDLSSALACSPSALCRIMRFLMHRGIFKEKLTSHGSIGYVQTPISRLLTRHGDKTWAPLVLLESSPVMLAPWNCLSARVLATETSAFVGVHSEDVWRYAAANPGYSKLIDQAMACDARVVVPKILDRCPEVFEGLSSLVDVGGGVGTTLRVLVKACPWIHGINFDLPHVLSGAPHCQGIEHVGGDMFSSIPKANAAFLKWVLHDWGDEECIHILKKCREAIPEGTAGQSKVIIVEAVIEEKERDKLKDTRLMLDMMMMARTNKGKERTAEEWAYVLREAGFTRHTVKHIQAVQSIIEAYPSNLNGFGFSNFNKVI